MLFSYNWLKEYITKIPRPEKLAELLTMHSFEVEGVKKQGNDYILDIDILPNRGHDCLCHLGVAREIAAITGVKLKPIKTAGLKKEKGGIDPVILEITCPKLVPRYSAVVIEGVIIKKSPDWLKERLATVGIRSINNIVDLTNFVMLETGQPLHAFDYDKIMGREMILRQSLKGEIVTTLDDSKRVLEPGILVVEDKGKRLVDLVGIMGGKLSEVDSKTKNIILQAGNFDRKTIYIATKKISHRTDASNIYIQGIDPNITMKALERCFFLLGKLGGGKVIQIIDNYSLRTRPVKIKIQAERIETFLGVKVNDAKIINILKRLGFSFQKKGETFVVEIPTRRLDISLPQDVVEEIGRIMGYERVKPEFPVFSIAPAKKNINIFWENAAKDIMKELGFSEVYNYSFVSRKDADFFAWDKGLAAVKNPVSSEQKYLRPGLASNLLKNAKKNLNSFEEIKIFEVGKIFKETAGNKIQETLSLSAIVNNCEFHNLKGVVSAFLGKMGLTDVSYVEGGSKKLSYLAPKKSVEIRIGGSSFGFLGEVNKKVLEDFKMGGRILLFELDFERLIKILQEGLEYAPIPQFPPLIRDLSILVPKSVKAGQVLEEIKKASAPLVKEISLFDIYEGQELSPGKKNLSFRIIYQAQDRTLEAKDVDEAQQKIINNLESNQGWEIRK